MLALRVLTALSLLVLGAATGLAATALHALWWGLLLGVAGTAATTVALPAGWWRRLPYGAGWAAMAGYLTVPRGEGDFLVAENLSGYALLATGVALVVASLATLPTPRRVPEPAKAAS